MIAECRAFLKAEHPFTYARIQKLARTYFPTARRGESDRCNLVTMTLLPFVRMRYREKWFEIEQRANRIFSFKETRLSHIAWDIALSLVESARGCGVLRLPRDGAAASATGDARGRADNHASRRCDSRDNL